MDEDYAGVDAASRHAAGRGSRVRDFTASRCSFRSSRSTFDRLAGFASERAGCLVRSAALFVFFGKRRTAVKILFADATGSH